MVTKEKEKIVVRPELFPYQSKKYKKVQKRGEKGGRRGSEQGVL